jgi:hypothetical protein
MASFIIKCGSQIEIIRCALAGEAGCGVGGRKRGLIHVCPHYPYPYKQPSKTQQRRARWKPRRRRGQEARRVGWLVGWGSGGRAWRTTAGSWPTSLRYPIPTLLYLLLGSSACCGLMYHTYHTILTTTTTTIRTPRMYVRTYVYPPPPFDNPVAAARPEPDAAGAPGTAPQAQRHGASGGRGKRRPHGAGSGGGGAFAEAVGWD